MTTAAPNLTQTIKGYEIREELGKGGFGAVYRAYQPVIEREVAIKVILPDFANRPEFIRNFEVEARLVARLEHPHIVPLFDFWRDPKGAYIVMRWIKGGSLRQWIQANEEPPPLEVVAKILDQIASALHMAHRNQVVHRDIKPENILMDLDGNAYVTDFGIALQADQHEEDPDGAVTGSLPYMPPEQIQSREISAASDVYSMGFVLYEMLTGKYPFEFHSPTQLIMAHISEEIPPLSDARPGLPDDFDDILQRATAKDPEERYHDLRDMAADFRSIMTGGRTLTTNQVEMLLQEISNPYKGLRAFNEADSDDFFGRELLVNELVNSLEQSTFMAVVGPSGSGKSSVVRAGLVPALRRGDLYGAENWFVADMVPGSDPIQALEAALLSIAPVGSSELGSRLRDDPAGLLWAVDTLLSASDVPLLLVIDQFEEVFTQGEDEATRTQFLDLIRRAVIVPDGRVRVVVTLRADFYDRPLYYEGFGALMRENTHVVLPMSAAEIERAITGPATRVGLEVNTDLIAAIVADVQEEPGALPLLQYALTEVFERRVENQLTLGAYIDIGGVTGALARRADEVYASLTPEAKAAARQVFLRLVTLGEGSEDTRRRVQQAELVSLIKPRHLLDDVLEGFGKFRLLTFDTDPDTRQPVIEVAHEAIIREWQLLRTWLNESRNDVHLQRILAGAVQEWQNADQDTSYLLRGSRLGQYEEWATESDVALSEVERQFLDTSIEAKREEQRQRRRVQIIAVGVGAVALVVMAVLTVFALGQSRTAQLEANNRATAQALSQLARETSDANAVIAATSAAEAQISADRALTLLLASEAQQALETDDSSRALALSLLAFDIGAAPDTIRKVLASAAYAPGARSQFTLHDGDIRSVTYTPNGTQILTAGGDNRIFLLDAVTGEVEHEFAEDQHYSPVNKAVFNEDGTRMVSGDEGGVVVLWDMESKEPMVRFEGHTRSVTDVDFGPFSASVVSSSDDGTVILWDTFSGEIVRQFEEHEGTVWTVDFSSDGSTIISGGRDQRVLLWDAATGEVLTEFVGHGGDVRSAAFSPDGTQIVTGSIDNTVILWDAFTGERIQLFAGHTGPVESVSFSSDQERILSSSQDGLVIMWSALARTELRRYRGHTASVNDIAFRPFSQQLASVSADQTLIIWDTVPGAQIRTFEADSLNLYTLAYGPNGETAMTSSDFHRLIVWDVANGQPIRFLDGHTDAVWSIAYSPDGTQVVSSSNNGDIFLWDLEQTEPLLKFADHDSGGVWSVAYSPDGETALSGSDDRAFILWDIETGEEIRRFDGYSSRVRSVAYSPDGTMALGGSDSAELKLWDIETGELLQTYEGGHVASVRSLSFTPDGEQILTGSDDTTVILWDTFSAEAIYRFEEHQNWVTTVRVSPDGRLGVSASEDRNVIFWDLETGEERWRFDTFDGGIWGIRFSPDGDQIITAFGSGLGREEVQDLVVQWRVDTFDALLGWVQANRVVPELSCEEQLVLGLDVDCAAGTA